MGLPRGIRAGREYTIVVRRVSTRRTSAAKPQPQLQLKVTTEAVVDDPGRRNRNWRNIVGTFAVRIPVITPNVMLPDNTLAIMKWCLAQMSSSNRWYPVLQRYIGYIAARVNGLGGNANAIQPSPWGAQGAPPTPSPKRHEFIGKVAGLIYDHFGDFEGFILETANCENHRFCSREAKVEAIVSEMWRDRSIVTVILKGKDSCCLLAIIAGTQGNVVKRSKPFLGNGKPTDQSKLGFPEGKVNLGLSEKLEYMVQKRITQKRISRSSIARYGILNPQPNPQILMSYTTSANFGSPRGSVKSLKSLITQRCHGRGRG